MKKNSFLFLLLSFLNMTLLYSQIDPPILEFKNLTPKWNYVSIDTNFIKSDLDPFSSKYWGRLATDIIFKDGNLFILEFMASQSPYSGREGYLLHCLDNSTGNMKWVHHNNSYVGYNHREWLNAESIRFLEDNSIQIFTYRDIDSIDFTMPKFVFYASPKMKIIDFNTGMTISEKHGNILEPETYNFTTGVNRVTTMGDGDIVQFNQNIFNESISLINSVELYDIDEDMNIVAPPTGSIEYDTEVNVDPSASFVPFYFKLNRDTLLALFASPDPSDNKNSPNELVLSWIDISEKSAFGELSRIDITDQVYYPQSPFNDNIFFSSIDNSIFVYQRVLDTKDAPIDASSFYWLSWFDNDGNKLSNIPFFGVNGKYYSELHTIGVKDGVAYVAGYLDGVYDLCKIEPGSNEINILGSIEVVNSEDIERIYMSLSKFIPNDEIIIGLRVVKENDQGRNTTFEYYYNFDINELGILTSSNDVLEKSNNVTIYPNPARNDLNIEVSGIRVVEIFDALGQKVHAKSISSTNIYNVNLLNYSSGLYTVLFTSKNGMIESKKLLINK